MKTLLDGGTVLGPSWPFRNRPVDTVTVHREIIKWDREIVRI